MLNKNRNVLIFILGLGLLSCFGLCYNIIFKPITIPESPPEFNQINCDRPCWYGLQAGISTRQDIQTILGTSLSDANEIQIEEGEYQSGYQYIKVGFLDETYKIHPNGQSPVIKFLFTKDNPDLVNRIYISDMLVMQQAFNTFGEPDHVIVYSHEFLPDFWKKDLHLYYNNRGLSISCFEGTTFSSSDRPPCFDTSEISLGYFNPEDFLDELEAQFGNSDIALQYMRPYQGLDAEYPILEQK
jgi:hypothetical protein